MLKLENKYTVLYAHTSVTDKLTKSISNNVQSLISSASQLSSSFGLLLYLHKLPSYLLCKENDENAFFCKAKLDVGRVGKTRFFGKSF